eukprot:TRINITY_DN4131_c0_g1_i3.p1 TRINITY_DN4131_c0_g1~~TRINITY_DN4131_c0_g1_i3.p1  ORF type:complete len:577 (+),score=152.74 TRINITY_DN4131_c0_g1_i3:245-1975(+)
MLRVAARIPKRLAPPRFPAPALPRAAPRFVGTSRGARSYCAPPRPPRRVSSKSSRDQPKAIQSLPQRVQTKWQQLATGFKVFCTDRVPELNQKARAWMIATLREVASDPRVLATWTVAGYRMVKEFFHHLWTGSKLLYANTRIATRLLSRATTGKQLTRSQQKLLMRTSTDLLRLIPFSFFILIPFMELLLPVALKIFPNLIPSTFETANQREKNYKAQLAVQVELAQQLRDVMLERVHLVSLDDDVAKSDQAVEFAVFLEKLKRGVHMSKSEITKAASFFRDEFTIDGASRSQLDAMAELMNIGVSNYAPIELLRFQIRRKLRIIQADDREIYWEGVANLSREDLVEANEDRGMPWQGMTDDQLRKQLNRWLLLSMNNAVPASLLILSRTFVLTNDQSRFLDGTAIASAIKSIPKDIVEDIQEDLMEEEKEKRDRRQQIKSDEQMLEELQAAEVKATEEGLKLDEMVEQDRLRTEEVASFTVELAQMDETLLLFDKRLQEIDRAIEVAVEEYNRSRDDGQDEDAIEARLSQKMKLERAVKQVEESKVAFKENLRELQGDVQTATKKIELFRSEIE